MFVKLALPLFIAAGAVARPAVMRRDTSIPPLSQWQSNNLESYWTFKVRYTSLGCAEQQGSDFYNSCCYPLPANQTASSECTPTSLTCAGVNPYDPSASLTTTSTSVAAPTPAPTVDSANNQQTPGTTQSVEDDYDESNLPYCEDPNDDGYYSDDNESESSYSDQSYTPPADNQQQPSPSSSADDSQYTPDSSSSTDNSNSGNNNNNNSNTSSNTNTNTSSGEIGDAFATYFYQNGNAGACGTVHSDYDLIGAIDQAWYGDLGSVSQYCGRSVTVTNTNNGKQVTITVADVCPTCDTNNSFDLSLGAFQQIADTSEGEVPITWHFN